MRTNRRIIQRAKLPTPDANQPIVEYRESVTSSRFFTVFSSHRVALNEPFFSQVLPCSSSSFVLVLESVPAQKDRARGRGTRTNLLGRFMAPMRVQSWRLKEEP